MSTTPARFARRTNAWSRETKSAGGGLPLKMHRTRKLNPVGRERQSRCHGRFNFHVYVLEAQPVGHCIADHILLESVQNAKDPSGFKQ